MIFGKVGRLGHGKTMRMVVDALDAARLRGAADGRCWVASNILIRVPEPWRFVHLPMDGFSGRLAELMKEARDSKAGLVVAVDEIDELWGAHDWQAMRRSDRHRIKQSRKYGTDFFYTAQFIDQVEKSIRNVTEEVELVRAFPAATLVRRERGKRPFIIRGQRFRPAAVREIIGTPDKDRRLSSWYEGWHLYRREHELLYDTDEIIEPEDTEALCARHQREEREARCPRCNPPGRPVGLGELVQAASESPLPPNGVHGPS